MKLQFTFNRNNLIIVKILFVIFNKILIKMDFVIKKAQHVFVIKIINFNMLAKIVVMESKKYISISNIK